MLRCCNNLCRKCCQCPSSVLQHRMAGCTADGTLLLMLRCVDTACRGPQDRRL